MNSLSAGVYVEEATLQCRQFTAWTTVTAIRDSDVHLLFGRVEQIPEVSRNGGFKSLPHTNRFTNPKSSSHRCYLCGLGKPLSHPVRPYPCRPSDGRRTQPTPKVESLCDNITRIYDIASVVSVGALGGHQVDPFTGA